MYDLSEPECAALAVLCVSAEVLCVEGAEGRMTIRDMVRDAQREIRDTELQPERARQLLSHLSAIIGNCNDEIRVADAEYATVLLQALDTEKKANRAKLRAECSPEFNRKREARDTKELVIELVRCLKYLLRSVEEEMRLAGRS
jgi:hypothetical protein